MLGLAKDYVPIEQRDKNYITRSKEGDVAPSKIEHQIALKFGLSRNYFTAKTKKVRLIRLLGAGNIEEGYFKYIQITDILLKEFNKMCEILNDRIWGYKTFDHFISQKNPYIQKLRREVDTYGITRYQKVSTLHHILKQFNRLEQIRKKPTLYIPLEDRLPLTEKFIKKYYWREKLTTQMIADELIVPEVWVQKEVTRLGMQKKKNGIKLRGKKGFVMPEEQKIKHQNQPHARAVVQICPRSFKVLRRWNATGAVERDGWARENVRKAIKSAGLHDGFLWAYEGKEEEIITRAKAKGDLEKKLKIWENGSIPKETLEELYIEKDMNFEQIAEVLGHTPRAIACRCSKFRLKKRVNISTETLRSLYIDQGLQAKEIAEIYGYSPKSISTYLSRRGITKHKKKKNK